MPGDLPIPRERGKVSHAGGFANPPGAREGEPCRGICQSPGSAECKNKAKRFLQGAKK